MDQLYAQTVAKPTSPPPSSSGAFMGLFTTTLLPIMILYYFFFIYLPGKEKKKKDALLGDIQRGDKVLTRGGLYGIVADIKDQILVLKISENSKVEVDRNYVETVIKPS